MTKHIAVAALTIGLFASAARAGPAFANPAEHFSLAVPDGLVPLTEAELARGNAATAAEGGTPKLYEAGFAPPEGPDAKAARLPLVLVRFVAGHTTVPTLADSYQADLAKLGPATEPTTGPTRPAGRVVVDDAAHTVSTEARRATPAGVVVKRKTVFVGHDGVVEVDWTGPAADMATGMAPLLASVRFDKGYEYAAPDVYVVRTVTANGGQRRTAATVIVAGAAVLFLAFAVAFFVRGRRRSAR